MKEVSLEREGAGQIYGPCRVAGSKIKEHLEGSQEGSMKGWTTGAIVVSRNQDVQGGVGSGR